MKNLKAIYVEELEDYFPELKKVKPERSLAEYFFTSTPAICKYVMENFKTVEEIVYLDADLFFFQSAEILFKEINNASISIIPHRFNFLNYYKNIYGFYNVGWISFKRNEEGMACLDKWFHNTVEWCFDKLTLNRYADQKYLNYWKRDFKDVCVIKNKGANLAPWNVGNYKISYKNNAIYVDKDLLIFYHFASLKLIDGTYYTTISSYFSSVTMQISDLIYKPYVSKLHDLGFTPRISARLNTNPVIKRMRKIIRHLYKDSISLN